MGEKYTNKRLKRILEFLYRNMSVEELEVLSRALLILFTLRIEANTGKMLNLDEDGHWYTTEGGNHYHVNEDGEIDKGLGGKANGVEAGGKTESGENSSNKSTSGATGGNDTPDDESGANWSKNLNSLSSSDLAVII